MSEIERCLLLTSIGWETATQAGKLGGIVRSLPIGSVLAEPWNTARLERCRRQLAEGTKPPPIKVVGLRRRGHKTLYSVSDGMHRTTAAAEAGRKTIRGEIAGWHDCDPPRFVIWRGWLWIAEPDRPGGYRSIMDDLALETIALLIGMGSRFIPDTEQISQSA